MNLSHPLTLLVTPYVLPAAMLTYAAWAMYLAAPSCLRRELPDKGWRRLRRGFGGHCCTGPTCGPGPRRTAPGC